MNLLSKIIIVASSLIILSTISSKAYVFDTWIIEGSNPTQMAEATEKFKEVAMNGGAKYLDIRASAKFRGDRHKIQALYLDIMTVSKICLQHNHL